MSSGGLLYVILLIVLCNSVHSIATEKRHFKICVLKWRPKY